MWSIRAVQQYLVIFSTLNCSARDANQFVVSVNVEPKAKMLFNLTYEELLTRRRSIYEQVHIEFFRIQVNIQLYPNVF